MLILLLLFAIRYRPIELVDARKKTKDNTSFSDNNNKDFNANNSNNFSAYNNNVFNNVNNVKHFNALCYKDVYLLLIQSFNKGEWDMLAIKVKIAYYKGHNRRLKL
jgi:hypothetical protein